MLQKYDSQRLCKPKQEIPCGIESKILKAQLLFMIEKIFLDI